MKQHEDLRHPWDQVTEDQAVELTPEGSGDLAAIDPFGLYLQQMGSIPMLSRQQELELTGRVDRLRRRYRHAALSSPLVLERVGETFEGVRAGALQLER